MDELKTNSDHNLSFLTHKLVPSHILCGSHVTLLSDLEEKELRDDVFSRNLDQILEQSNDADDSCNTDHWSPPCALPADPALCKPSPNTDDFNQPDFLSCSKPENLNIPAVIKNVNEGGPSMIKTHNFSQQEELCDKNIKPVLQNINQVIKEVHCFELC